MQTTQNNSDIIAKTVRALLVHATADTDKAGVGTHFELDVTQKDIGALLGLSRAEATYALNFLKLEGLIAIEGSTILIPDVQALSNLQ